MPTVFVVSSDPALRQSFERLLELAGFHVEIYRTTEKFLASKVSPANACLILDLDVPAHNGARVHRELIARRTHVPVIYIAEHGDIPMAVRAMRLGAFTFLSKPVRESELTREVRKALAKSRRESRRWAEVSLLRKRHANLTAREHQVFKRVVAGKLNKQIAFDLHIGEATVKVHRGRMMRKMQATSVAELVIMAEQLGDLQTRN